MKRTCKTSTKVILIPQVMARVHARSYPRETTVAVSPQASGLRSQFSNATTDTSTGTYTSMTQTTRHGLAQLGSSNID